MFGLKVTRKKFITKKTELEFAAKAMPKLVINVFPFAQTLVSMDVAYHQKNVTVNLDGQELIVILVSPYLVISVFSL